MEHNATGHGDGNSMGAKNIEVKARLPGGEAELERVEQAAAQACDQPNYPQLLQQHDTFFQRSDGRLKLRVLDGGPEGLLIHYTRSDQAGPKSSDWVLTRVPDADALRSILGVSAATTPPPTDDGAVARAG